MKIAIDLRPLQIGHENRGIGMYLLNILQYLPPDADYIYLRYQDSNPITDYGINKGRSYVEVTIPRYRFSRNPRKLLKFLFGLIKPVFPKIARYHPDIFLQTDYLLGIPRRRSIITAVVAYDLIPFRFRNAYLPSWKKYYSYKQFGLRARVSLTVRAFYYEKKYNNGLRTLRRANKIISISETTKKDLVQIGHVDAKKIETIYLAPSFLINDTSKPSVNVTDIIKPIKHNYLLFIGGTDLRRKVHELVFAFNLLNSRGIETHLVLAGNEFVKNSKQLNPITKRAIETSSFRDKIHLLGKISEVDKLYVLENASSFVYPTLFEGFGLPLLEAMKAKCPVITFRNDATLEIAQDAAIYTSTDDGFGIFEAVKELANNPDLRRQTVDRGTRRCGDFNWNSTGTDTVDYLFS